MNARLVIFLSGAGAAVLTATAIDLLEENPIIEVIVWRAAVLYAVLLGLVLLILQLLDPDESPGNHQEEER